MLYVIQEWGDHEYRGVAGIFLTSDDAERHLRNIGATQYKDYPDTWEDAGRASHYQIEDHPLGSVVLPKVAD